MQRCVHVVDAVPRQAPAIVADAVFEEVVKSAPVDTGRTRDAWRKQRINEHHVDVVNPLPHASILDRGSSKQAPDGILRQAVPRSVGSAEKELERLLDSPRSL